MKSFDVLKSKLFVESGLLDSCGNIISSYLPLSKVLIISDKNVSKFYFDRVRASLTKAGFEVFGFIIDPGERSKSQRNLEKIYNELSENFMTRFDIILGLGGGVVTDLSGFAAATYKRGMKLVYIPTSLLSQVDASIGGKNGVNLECGKNLVGTFYHPDMILIDPMVLKTLSRRDVNSGIAEIIKCGCIKDNALFESLLNKDFFDDPDEFIFRSAFIKQDVVEKDELDLGERMLLNFGHTIGHAIESLTKYELFSHGEAVSIGMNMMTNISESLGLTEKGTAKKLLEICKKYSLPSETDISNDKLLKVMMNDKKINSGFLNFVLLRKIGEGYIHKVPCEKARDFIESSCNICVDDLGGSKKCYESCKDKSGEV